jgi:hypothetical protein
MSVPSLTVRGSARSLVSLNLLNTALLARRPTKVAAIALANKIARMAWAMMARGDRYKEPIDRACGVTRSRRHPA